MLRDYELLLPYLRRHRGAYALGAVCLVGSIAFKLLIPFLLGGAIDELRELEQAAPGTSDAPAPEVASLITRGALTIALTAAAVALLRTTSRLAVLGSSRRVVARLREVVFDSLLSLAPSFYIRNPTGQILSRSINDMMNVQSLMGPVILYLAEISVLYVIALWMMLGIDPELTLLALAPFPIFLFNARRVARRIQTDTRRAQNALGEIATKVDESLSGQLVIKTLALEDFDARNFDERSREYRRINLRVARDRAWLMGGMTILASLSILIVLAVGAPRVGADLSLGDLMAMILYVQMLAVPTRTLGFVLSSLRRGAAALGRIREILDSERALVEPEQLEHAPLHECKGEIELRELSIVHAPLTQQPHLSGSLPETEPSDEERERRVLDRVSFELPAGTTLGIVGHTGAGKTTLVRAIARQLEVQPGRLFFDGHDATHLPLAELRRQIGFVPQDSFLFSMSLADNIALGRPDASRGEIEAAVAAAQLEKDLAQMPEGLDTIVGERGVKLSGGQRQRAALARVLLMKPRILILDDTLSAVDTQTADEILAHLRPFARQRTTILVAHRLSTLRHADQILVLAEGRVVERGVHAELIEGGGMYAELWALQEQQDREQIGARRRARELALDEGAH